MSKKVLGISILLLIPLLANAQWRIGLTAGGTYNTYSRDAHYMNDWHYEGAWGGTIGVMGQYDVTNWFGLRADLNWAMKNHRQYRTLVRTDYNTFNGYVQMPVLASFSFGNPKLKGFVNLGVYGGYWLNSSESGKWEFPIANATVTGTYDVSFDDRRDQRFDYGLVGGIGLEWRFKLMKQNWAWQIFEARIYYSTQSIQKDYMKVKDPRYNTTLAIQSGFCYFF